MILLLSVSASRPATRTTTTLLLSFSFILSPSFPLPVEVCRQTAERRELCLSTEIRRSAAEALSTRVYGLSLRLDRLRGGLGRGMMAGLLFLSVLAAFHLLHFPPDLSTLLNCADPVFSSFLLSSHSQPPPPFSCPSYPSSLPSPPIVFLRPPLISIFRPACYFLFFFPGLLSRFLSLFCPPLLCSLSFPLCSSAVDRCDALSPL